jgi:hypothetical protein
MSSMHADPIQFTSSVGASTDREYLFDGHTATGRLIADLVGGVSYLIWRPKGNQHDVTVRVRPAAGSVKHPAMHQSGYPTGKLASAASAPH